MTAYWLRFELRSAATFGRGDGVAGLVDREVEHDADGFPYVRGRTLRGLLHEECANILFALKDRADAAAWRSLAVEIFGQPGSRPGEQGQLRVGDACLPAALRESAHRAMVVSPNVTPTDVLESLTGIRRQTAMTVHGAPETGSLRSMRIVLRGVTFEAPLAFPKQAEEKDLALLTACILAVRRAGTGRNRGRGRLLASLYDGDGQDVTETYFRVFQAELRP